MPHRQLSAPVLILSTILVKLCLRAKPVCGNVTEWSHQIDRSLLQTASSSTVGSQLEYDPALDDPVQLSSLIAVYDATGGPYWSYQNHFASSGASGVAAAPSPSQAAEEKQSARFANRYWLDMSVSYCQWYASCALCVLKTPSSCCIELMVAVCLPCTLSI